MKWDKPDLSAVPYHKKDKGELEHRGLELAAYLTQVRPEEGIPPSPRDLLGGKIEEHSAEEGLGYTDTTEDEILPRRLDSSRSLI